MVTQQPSQERIAVTGATGFVGSATVAALLERGVKVRRLMSNPSPTDTHFDFFKPNTFAPALAECSSLFLLRPPAIGDVKTHLFPVINAAVAAGVKRIVFLSVMGAESRSYLPHAKVEAHLKTVPSSVAVGILRPGFFAQNLLSAYLDDIVQDNRLYVCAGNARVAFVDTNDLGAVAARALVEGVLDGRAAALTGGLAVSFEEVAAILSDILGRPIRYVPASIVGFFMHRLRRRSSFIEAAIVTALHANLRGGNAETVNPSLGELLGREPTTVRQMVTRVCEKFQPRNPTHT
jgi:uncharacterized protein YbjT (DUF2867 family)